MIDIMITITSMDPKKVTKQFPSLNNTTKREKKTVIQKLAEFLDADQTGWKRQSVFSKKIVR